MKKVLSVLLAVCLFATLLVPAFAQGIPTHGKLADVAKVEFDKTEYKLDDITRSTEKGLVVDVTALLTCWDSNGNRTNFENSGLTQSEIRAYWTSNNAVLVVDDDGVISRLKPYLSSDARITLRVTLASGKQAETTIIVPANKAADKGTAYGYRLANVEVEEGKFVNGSTDANAKLSFTATAMGAGILNILGTPVTLTSTEDTAAKVAAKIRTDVASFTNAKGVKYDVDAVDADHPEVVTWTAVNVIGALEETQYTTEAERATSFTVSGSGDSIIGTPIDGVAASVSGGTAGTIGAAPAAQQLFTTDSTVEVTFGTFTIDPAYTGVLTDSAKVTDINAGLTALVAGFTAAKNDGATNIDSIDFTLTTAGGCSLEGATGLGTDTNPATVTLKKGAATLGIFTITFSAPVTAIAKTDTINTGFATAAKYTAGDTAVAGTANAGTKAEFVYEAKNALGAKFITVGGVEITLTGKELAKDIATKIIGDGTKEYSIKGDVFTASAVAGQPTQVKFTQKTPGTLAINGVLTVADVAAYGATKTPAVSASNGSDNSNGTSFIYNIGDEITPILSSYAFTGDQKNAFRFAIRTTQAGANSHKFVLEEGVAKDMYGLEFLVSRDADGYPQLEIGQGANFDKYKGTYVYVRVLNDQFANAQSEKEFSVKLVGAAGAKESILPAEAYVGVGQTLDLTTLNKSVDGVKTYWSVQPYGNYQNAKTAGMTAKMIIETVDDNKVPYGWTVKGLAPGVVTIALHDSKGNLVDTMKLNVGAGSPATPTPSTANATVKVNEQVKLSVKNLNSDEYVKWSIDNNNVSLANYDGAAATVYGKKEGTAVVTAKVYESKAAANDGKDPINTFKINVTVKAAESKPVTTPGTTAPTTNPQTGDSIFANLF